MHTLAACGGKDRRYPAWLNPASFKATPAQMVPTFWKYLKPATSGASPTLPVPRDGHRTGPGVA